MEEFPDDLTKVSGILRSLDLSVNRLGSLPGPTIGSFKALKTLNLSANRLVQLPPELGQLIKLETLLLQDNRITELPSTCADLKNLKELNLARNGLTAFPAQILSKLRKLDSVDLSGNRITSVPDDEAVEAFNATELNLNRNQVSFVSARLAKCSRLKILRLDENCLSLEALPAQVLADSAVSTLSVKGNLFSEKQLAEAEGYQAYMDRYAAVRRKMD